MKLRHWLDSLRRSSWNSLRHSIRRRRRGSMATREALEERVVLSAVTYLYLIGPTNPLNGIDIGDISTPTFGDLDGDGDLDAVSGELGGTFHYFENTGTPQVPGIAERTGVDNPFNGFDVGSISAPNLGDLDGDGDLDLVAGDSSGNLSYFENTGTSTSPTFVQRLLGDNPLNGINVGNSSAPALADFDDDSDLDLVVGSSVGVFSYYENTGTASSPVYSQLMGVSNPLDGFDVGQYSTPAVGDVDGDGDLDLMSGEFGGTILYFENTGNSSAAVFSQRTGSANPLDGYDLGDVSTPSLGDFDADGDLDLGIGRMDGTVAAFAANFVPSDLQLPDSSIPEYGTSVVGTFNTVDANVGEYFFYDFAVGAGDTDNSSFWIAGNELQVLNSLDFEAKSQYSIRVRSIDSMGDSVERSFTIRVTDVNDAPELNTDGMPYLTTIKEDAVSNNGTLIYHLLASLGPNRLTDQDAGAKRGIAIIGTDTTNCVWQFRRKDSEAWYNVGNRSETSALLLASSDQTRIRFVPNKDYNGFVAPAITFVAWDRSSGSNGLIVDVTNRGNDTPYSLDVESASISVEPVNDPPTYQYIDNLKVNEQAPNALVGNLTTLDKDTGEFHFYSILPGGNGDEFVTFENQLYVGAAGLDYNAGATRTVTIRSMDAEGLYVDRTYTVIVKNVNDAPVLDPSGDPNLDTIPMNAGNAANPGTLVSDILARMVPGGITDHDSGALQGIALFLADQTNGVWQFKKTDAAPWTNIGSTPLFEGHALLLASDATTRIRFVPNPDYSGYETLRFRAWDRTAGSAGSFTDISVNGNSTPFSVEFEDALLFVEPDAPIAHPPPPLTLL